MQKGLKTHENTNFINYFRLVQKEAELQKSIFFLNTQESVEQVINDLECCNLSGWLIPIEQGELFEKEFLNKNNLDKWNIYEAWVEWKIEKNNVKIDISLL